jgi:FixJ family two-component response regulator
VSYPERKQRSDKPVYSAPSTSKADFLKESNQVVLVIDDDRSVREAITSLIKAVGLSCQTFASGHEFLEAELPDVPRCLVLDVRLPGLSGLNVQRELSERQIQIPIIFVTGYGDIPMTVQAMKAGAVEFLTKPFRDQDLLDAIEQAIQRDRLARSQRTELSELEEHYELLTPREREVMELVVAGRLNKQIAVELEISEKTVNVHRAQAMQKMRADSLAELVRMSEKLRLSLARPQEHWHGTFISEDTETFGKIRQETLQTL